MSILFQNWTWDLGKTPKILETLKIKRKEKNFDYVSQYCVNAKRKQSTIHIPFTNALDVFIENFENQDDSSCLAIGTSGLYTICEYRHGDSTTLVAYNNNDRVNYGVNCIFACEIKGTSVTDYSFNENSSNKRTGVALFFPLIFDYGLNDDEFNFHFKSLDALINTKLVSPSEKHIESLFILNDNFYRRAMANKIVVEDVYPLDVAFRLSNEIDNVFCGKFKYFNVARTNTKKASNCVSHEDFVSKYKLDEDRVLTPSEENLIPKLEDWFIVPDEAIKICKHAKATSDLNMKMRNFMLTGVAGTGKTMTSRAIASGLGLPYLAFTCNAGTEIFDLIGQILPDFENDNTSNNNSDSFSYPDLIDIIAKPKLAYEKLTGMISEETDSNIVYEELLKKVSSVNENGVKKLKFVKSPILEALENGYCLELQEPSVISNPGVLVGLNGLLDTTGYITLPNGEKIKRHPDSVIIITTNDTYNGCTDLNQSVISRMHLIIRTETPSKDTIIDRVTKITGFSDTKLLSRMYNVFEKISQRCKEMMIEDGSVGFREFLNWVVSTSITKNAYESALLTIISSSSMYEESRNELIETCLKPVFG